MKPISPKEAKLKKATDIPEGVIQAFNELIVENLSGGESSFTQDEVLKRIKKYTRMSRDVVINQGMLDVETLYGVAGWTVEYCSPDRGESFDAYFKFSN